MKIRDWLLNASGAVALIAFGVYVYTRIFDEPLAAVPPKETAELTKAKIEAGGSKATTDSMPRSGEPQVQDAEPEDIVEPQTPPVIVPKPNLKPTTSPNAEDCTDQVQHLATLYEVVFSNYEAAEDYEITNNNKIICQYYHDRIEANLNLKDATKDCKLTRKIVLYSTDAMPRYDVGGLQNELKINLEDELNSLTRYECK